MDNFRYNMQAWHEEVVPLPDSEAVLGRENSVCETGRDLKNNWWSFNARTSDCNDDRGAEPGRR